MIVYKIILGSRWLKLQMKPVLKCKWKLNWNWGSGHRCNSCRRCNCKGLPWAICQVRSRKMNQVSMGMRTLTLLMWKKQMINKPTINRAQAFHVDDIEPGRPSTKEYCKHVWTESMCRWPSTTECCKHLRTESMFKEMTAVSFKKCCHTFFSVHFPVFGYALCPWRPHAFPAGQS